MERFEKLVACLALAVLVVIPSGNSAQTTEPTPIANVISTSTALYILLGIAALYFTITLTCILLVVCTCYTNHKKEIDRSKVYEYEELNENSPPVSPLDPIPEVVTSDVEFKSSPPSSDDECDLPESKTQITVYSNKLASDVFMAETNNLNFQKHCDSPLMKYTPKMSPTPHSEVKVPFSDSATSKPSLNQPPSRHSHNPTSQLRAPGGKFDSPAMRRVKSGGTPQYTGRPGSEGSPDLLTSGQSSRISRIRSDNTPKGPNGSPLGVSPFSRRKNPAKEVASLSTGITGTRICSDNTPKGSPSRSPFNKQKNPAKEVANLSITVSGSYSPKRSPPGSVTAAKTTSTSSKKTNKTGNQTNKVTAVRLIYELKQASGKWYSIGTQFKISSVVLDAINTVYVGQEEQCLAKVCEEWMNSGSKVHSWSEVVEVLNSKEVKEKDLANSIHLRYCSGYLTHKDTGEDEDNGVSWID